MAKVTRKSTARLAKSERPGPVSMGEALERLLSHCGSSPHKVASRLDAQHRDSGIQLLGGDVVMAPSANPAMLGIKAHILPDGKACLYVQLRGGLTGHYPIWDCKTVESLKQHHEFWTFERESFEANLPGAPKNRGGSPREFNVEDLLAEALVYAGVAGGLPRTVEGEGSLLEKLKQRLGSRCPERVTIHKIFGPIYQRIKTERQPRV